MRRYDGSGGHTLLPHSPLQIGEPSLVTPATAARDGGAIGLAFERLFTVPFGTREVGAFRSTALRRVEIADAERPEAGQSTLRAATGVLALVCAIAAVSLSSVAVSKSVAANGSQQDVERDNSQIAVLNRVSIPCYAVAVLGGAAWAWGPWW